jgi:hypothetical protein
MKPDQLKKVILTIVLLFIIDRIEFAYYPFQGLDRSIGFVCCHEPISVSWWVYLISIQMQLFLFTVILYLWVPLKKEMLYVMIAFGVCVIEFPITYGWPIAQIPMPFNLYFPVSCSLLRLASICYLMYVVVKKILNDDN